ncbi:hypothetical protein AKJ37_03610 [candidate division MSBL1 archaeon SCGC-AAA259I09]|uniref:Uncharacterized protein n=2 Tax=candidate division MSBL1 TaxID=215777 RepID=A0A133USP1_9EURY|nr:hypothetical protein AKJ66_02295 [candidate division MSBL1 archaeon SCGC-AAA259E22]KXA97150.1 hypothetical protein AKJ37_03610 [candidate division MSBL1 archaeon SCGC-AAA259I09]
MKEFIEIEVEVDLESVVEDSQEKDDALQMLNYRLKKKRSQAEEEFEKKYVDLKVEFEKELDKIWKE